MEYKTVCHLGINCQCFKCTFRANCRFCGCLHINTGFMLEHERYEAERLKAERLENENEN